MKLKSPRIPPIQSPVSPLFSPEKALETSAVLPSDEFMTCSSSEGSLSPSLKGVPPLSFPTGPLFVPGPVRRSTGAEDYAVSLFKGPIGLPKDEAISSCLANLRGPALNRVLERVSLEDLLDQSAHSTLWYVLPVERLDTLGARARLLSAPVLLALLTTLFREPSCRNPRLAMTLIRALRPSNVRFVKEGLELLNPVGGLSSVIKDLVGENLVSEAAAVMGKVRPSGRGVEQRVFTDIDDTIVCGWKDTRYPGHCIYPGATTFLRKLRQSVNGHQENGLGISLLSARPDDALGVMRWATNWALDGAGLGNATKLLGGFLHVFPESRIIGKKYQNFSDSIRWFPEGQFVFVGDSGQKDTEVGLKMLKEAPLQMKGVFIHQVTDVPAPRREELAAQRVWLFSNYAEAAEIALKRGLLSAEDAEEVALAAKQEFAGMTFSKASMQSARQHELDESCNCLSTTIASMTEEYFVAAA